MSFLCLHLSTTDNKTDNIIHRSLASDRLKVTNGILVCNASLLALIMLIYLEIFLPSYVDYEFESLERKREPVHEIRLSDEEMKSMFPQWTRPRNGSRTHDVYDRHSSRTALYGLAHIPHRRLYILEYMMGALGWERHWTWIQEHTLYRLCEDLKNYWRCCVWSLTGSWGPVYWCMIGLDMAL